MKRNALRVACSRCGGSGEVEFTGVYADTLRQAIRMLSSGATEIIAGRDADSFGCAATALNNRLAYLERQGFLTSVSYGRQRRFMLANGKGKK
jgi:response regulator of citrate/malate metabolism